MSNPVTTVSELIERLKQHPGDMPVVVSGFDENGYNYIRTIEPVSMQRNTKDWMHAPDYVPPGESGGTGDTLTALHIDF